MLRFLLPALLLLSSFSFAGTPFGTTVEVTEVTAITAESARVEPLDDSVAVFLIKESPDRKQGLQIDVKSAAKFSVVRATSLTNGRPQAVSKLASGGWILFGQQGEYLITVIESDPELGINFTDVEATIGKPTKPDLPPDTNPDIPPIEGVKLLAELVRKVAGDLNEPEVAKALSAAYRSAADQIEGSGTIEAAKEVVIQKRREALRTSGFKKNWNVFLLMIEPEVLKFSTDLQTYKQAILTIAEAL